MAAAYEHLSLLSFRPCINVEKSVSGVVRRTRTRARLSKWCVSQRACARVHAIVTPCPAPAQLKNAEKVKSMNKKQLRSVKRTRMTERGTIEFVSPYARGN